MVAGILTEPTVAKKAKPKPTGRSEPKGPPPGTGRIELQAPDSWILKLDRAAEALGMSRSAYIRMACNRQMAMDAKATD